ncbi:HAAS signaling domain-containing protein [Staphylococcus caprae]|uniref:HAAS signaling domain-containing protein n=1 Tax=Staphylococcus caprae TaxID=29380 RepID=UPI001C82F76C|nr:DUF1700 domain-containing protein [Staphylococcus caprae]MBX5318980.1 DUF1700 domain-containing protein [Staphylococcus caprae]MDI9231413.1 DUF1700 domain-containing protein [Staphylococcus caprae]
MDKITFLNELELALDELPRNEKDNKMYEYENLFYEEELKGNNEEQIVKKLKDPYDIAKEIKAKSAISYASSKPTIQNITKAIFASLSLGILSIFIILIPVVIIALLLLILLFLSICLLFSPIILIVYSLLNGFHNSISNILFSISLAGLGIIFIVLTFKIMHIVHKLILRYLLWYIKTVKGSVRE